MLFATMQSETKKYGLYGSLDLNHDWGTSLGKSFRVSYLHILLRYLREQSLSVDYHRYGNLGEREV